MKPPTPDIEALYQERMMQRSPSERLAMACRMFATAKALAVAGIEHDHGKLPPHELRLHLLRRFYSEDFSPEQLEAIARHLASRDEDNNAAQ